MEKLIYFYHVNINMPFQLDLDNLADEILGYVKEEKVMSGLSILCRYGSTHSEIPLKYAGYLSMNICNTLKNLVIQRKLRDLYPSGVKPESALMSEIYYIILE